MSREGKRENAGETVGIEKVPVDDNQCTLNHKIQFCAIFFLLLLTIACSGVAVTGLDAGWLKWSKKNVLRDDSPYAGMIKYVFMMNPDPNNVDPGFIDAVEFQMPQDVPFDITVTLGWLRLKSYVRVIGGDPVAPHIQILGRSLTPKKYHEQLDEIFGEGKCTLEEDYVGDRTAGKVTGALCVVALGISALAGCAIVLGLVGSRCTGRIPVFVVKILSNAYILAMALYSVYILELVVGCAGGYRDTERNPLVQKGYVPWPDWAWILAMVGATAWMVMWLITRKNKECIHVPLSLSLPVASKQSWNIPAMVEENSTHGVPVSRNADIV